ncbi:MAG: tetratricopeptide repeat protein [Bacteroidales bacterium]|nr:tetratricopeptide repeat protein [Bacteroidales bacterium]
MKEIRNKILLFSVFLMIFGGVVNAQETKVYDQPESSYQDALALFNKELYGSAQKRFQETIDNIQDPYSNMRINAEYYNSICAVELFNNNAEILLQNFIDNHSESTHIKYIYFQLGKFQFRKKAYRRVIKSFKEVDVYDLSEVDRQEFNFKAGYSHFRMDSIREAKKYFYELLNINESKYRDPATYYYSHISYTDGNYSTALKGFLSLKENESFRPIIPYYITHIYYLQEDYDKLLEYAPVLLEKSIESRKPEIARLIGEAYYHKGEYEKAIPYLDQYYELAGGTASEGSRYQMAYSYYKTGNYEKAIHYFKSLSIGSDTLSQNANYHIAFCYLKVDKPRFALNAFKYAYSINKDPMITEDALFNFAKLSYELAYNPYNQAIIAFRNYVDNYPNSEHRNEAMGYLTKMYLSTRSYQEAMHSIEQIDNKSPELLVAYHRIVYARAIEVFNEGEYQQSLELFDKSIKINQVKKYSAESEFWRAETYYRLANYPASIKAYHSFITSPGAFSMSVYQEANYNIGYAYFKQNNYDEAKKSFRLFAMNEKDHNSDYVNDAYNRIGDCYYINKEFIRAIEFYDKAIAIGKKDVDYALFKRAEAFAPQRKYSKKVESLQKLLNDYPKSYYAGNAEYQIASTYFRNLKEYSKAVSHYKHIIDTYAIDRNFVKRSMLDLGSVYINMDKEADAIITLKSVNKNYKGSRESKEAVKILKGIYTQNGNVDEFLTWLKGQGIKYTRSEEDSIVYFAAENIYMQGDCEKSTKEFSKYLRDFPNGFFVSGANFYMADCEFRAGKYADALINYQVLIDMPVSEYTEKSLQKVAYVNFEKYKDYKSALVAYNRLKEVTEYKKINYDARIGIMRCYWNLENADQALKSAEDVLTIGDVDEHIRIEAKMIIAKTHYAQTKDSLAYNEFAVVSDSSSGELSAEARYLMAEIKYNAGDYEQSESLIYDIIEQDPSYEYWLIKAFILSGNIFVKTDNLHQARATLNSIVEGVTDYPDLVQEAKDLIAEIDEMEAKIKSTEKSDDMIIEFNQDEALFIGDFDDTGMDAEEEYIDSEEEGGAK